MVNPAFVASATSALRRSSFMAVPSRLCSAYSTVKVALPSARRVSVPCYMTLSPGVTQALVAIYGLLITGGGVSAYIRTKSKASLGSSLGAGAFLAAAFSTQNTTIALGTAIVLGVLFASRYAKGKKTFTAVLCALSFVFAGAFAYALYG